MLELLLLFASASFAEECKVKNKFFGSSVGKTRKSIITVCDGTGLGS